MCKKLRCFLKKITQLFDRVGRGGSKKVKIWPRMGLAFIYFWPQSLLEAPPDFELLDSQSTHHHLPISKKIHREIFFLSQSMLLPLVMTKSRFEELTLFVEVASLQREGWVGHGFPVRQFTTCFTSLLFCNY